MVSLRGQTISNFVLLPDGDAAVVYKLLPSCTVVKRSMAGVCSPAIVSCQQLKVVGNAPSVSTTEKTLLYQTSAMASPAIYDAPIAVGVLDWIEFSLKSGSTLLDVQRVQVVSDAGDMDIGVRNLLLKSGVAVTTANYLMGSWYFGNVKPVAGKTYTIVIKGELGAGRVGFCPYNSGGMIPLGNITPADKISDNIYRKTITWAIAGGGYEAANTHMAIYQPNSSLTSSSTIEWIKLVEGNITSNDWIAASEDQEVVNTHFSSRFEVTDSLIAGKVSATDYASNNKLIGARFTSIEQTSDEIKLSVSNNKDQTDVQSIVSKAMAGGKCLHPDATFAEGGNNVGTYNNSVSTGSVTVNRVTAYDSPTGSNYVLRVTSSGVCTPGRGGVVQNWTARANAVFIQRIIAKIPVGFTINSASNAQGDGTTQKWLTPQEGTGTWTEYIYMRVCGSTGTFGWGGHIYINGGNNSQPLTWDIALMTCYDATSCDIVTNTSMRSYIKAEADKIELKVGQLNTKTDNAQKAADDARAVADETKASADTTAAVIAAMTNDNTFDVAEKQATRIKWQEINGISGTGGTYKKAYNEAYNCGVTTTELVYAYQGLRSYLLTVLSLNVDSDTVVDGFRNALSEKFGGYYAAEQAIWMDIADAKSDKPNLALKTNQGATGWGFMTDGGEGHYSIGKSSRGDGIEINISNWDNLGGWQVLHFDLLNRAQIIPGKTYAVSFDMFCDTPTMFSVGFANLGGVVNGNWHYPAYGGDVVQRITAVLTPTKALTNEVLYIANFRDEKPKVIHIDNLIIAEGTAVRQYKPASDDRIEQGMFDTGIDIEQGKIRFTQNNAEFITNTGKHIATFNEYGIAAELINVEQLNVQRVICYNNQGQKISSMNEVGDGCLKYYYPNGVLMREDAFVYDGSGNVSGVETRFYDKTGKRIWTFGNDKLPTQDTPIDGWETITIECLNVKPTMSGMSGYNLVVSKFIAKSNQYTAYNGKCAIGKLVTQSPDSSSINWLTGWQVGRTTYANKGQSNEKRTTMYYYYYEGAIIDTQSYTDWSFM